MVTQDWKDLKVQLHLHDETYVGQGMCCKLEPTDSVDDEILGDSYVGVRVLDVVKDYILLD